MIAFLALIMLVVQLGIAPQKPALTAHNAASVEPVEIILFTDFQCPFCAQFAQTFREVQTRGIAGVPTTVRFKHFPLNIHPAAPLAHQAALAAGEQGKFWEMHDLLFANQAAVQPEDLLRYARKLRLNLVRFKKDLASARLKQKMEADLREGLQLGVRGTPSFFVNGKGYSGAYSYAQLQQLVQRELQRKTALAEITDEMLSRGPGAAPVTLEFFADLQSPVSRPALATLEQIISQYPTQVRLQFRNFPLAFHPQAPLAHEAAMAAAAQGKFWEFMRYLLTQQESLREQDLLAEAQRLGLDEKKLADVLAQHRYATRIEADLEAGAKRGIRGSPVVFVNGKRIDGVPSTEQLVQLIEAELTSKSEARRQ